MLLQIADIDFSLLNEECCFSRDHFASTTPFDPHPHTAIYFDNLL